MIKPCILCGADNSEDNVNADLNLLKIIEWIQHQQEYDSKIYWLINELWKSIWPNDYEVHSNLIDVKESVTRKFEGDKRFSMFESFGFYGVIFFNIGAVFFVSGDIYGQKSSYAMGFLSFASGYLFFLVGKYQIYVVGFVQEGSTASFFDYDATSTLMGLLACLIGWGRLSFDDSLSESWNCQAAFSSGMLWVISGAMFFYSAVFKGKNFWNWLFYESLINFCGTICMLVNVCGRIQWKVYNIYHICSFGTFLFLVGGISALLRQKTNIVTKGKNNLIIIMGVLRKYLKSN